MSRSVPFALIAPLLAVPLCGSLPVAAAAEGAVQAEASYFEGLDRYRAGDFAGALDRFDRALEQGPSPALRDRALQAFVRSALDLSATERRDACGRLAPRVDAIARLDARDDAGRQALQDLQVMQARCAPPAPEATVDEGSRLAPRPTPPTRPDHGRAWAFTAGAAATLGGGAALYILAIDAVDAREAATDRYLGATDEGSRITAARAVGLADGQAETRAIGAAALLAAGGVLTGLAIWAWVDPPETLDVPFALGVGPGSLTIGGAF